MSETQDSIAGGGECAQGAPRGVSGPHWTDGSLAEGEGTAGERGWIRPVRRRSPQDLRLEALVSLLADPDESIWRTARRELERCGRASLAPLRRAERSADPRLRLRARDLTATLTRRDHLRRLVRTACARPFDLEAALWRLAALSEPHFDARPHRERLDEIAHRVGERARAAGPGLTRTLALVDVLHQEEGFQGGQRDYHHPDHVHLHRCLATGRGLPLTLAALHMAVGRRVGLTVRAVALPGHVLVRLVSGDRSLLIDPFHGGRIRTRKDCLHYLLQQGLTPRQEWFEDADELALFGRHLNNLRHAYRAVGRRGEARELERALEHVARVPRSDLAPDRAEA